MIITSFKVMYNHLLGKQHEETKTMTANKVKRIKVVQCLSSEVVKKDENCIICRDRGCCLTINPELANLIDKCKKSEGIYEFTQEASSLIRAKYPRALEFDQYSGMHPSPAAMRDFLIETYYETEIMPLVVTESIIKKLEKDEDYTDEEIELLYIAITEKYDDALAL